MCPVRHRNEEKNTFYQTFWKCLTNKTTLTFFGDNFDENDPKKLWCQIVQFIMSVPYCPCAKLCVFLSWCQIVCLLSWWLIVLFYYIDAKFSGCQIVLRQIICCQVVLPPLWLSIIDDFIQVFSICQESSLFISFGMSQVTTSGFVCRGYC